MNETLNEKRLRNSIWFTAGIAAMTIGTHELSLALAEMFIGFIISFGVQFILDKLTKGKQK